jgi:hypothetical protein
MAKVKRKPVTPSKDRPIKTTLSLDVGLYTRLCALAAMRRCGISALACDILRDALRGVIVFDRTGESDHVEAKDRLGGGSQISLDGDEAA